MGSPRRAIRRAIALVNAAADGAGDEEVTPGRIAQAIETALREPALSPIEVQRDLRAALDAVADGMPADFIASCLYRALKAS